MRQFDVGDLGEVQRGRIVDGRQLTEIAKLSENRIESGFVFCLQGGSDGAAECKLKTVEGKRVALVADLIRGGDGERKVLDGVFERVDGDHGGSRVFFPPRFGENGFENLGNGRFLGRIRTLG